MIMDVIDSALRGIGQVVFMNNPITGIFILIATFVHHPFVGLMGLVGVLSGTLTAILLGLDQNLRRAGLFGYNAHLVGCCLATFDAAGPQSYHWETVMSVVLFSVFSVIIFTSLGSVLGNVASLTLGFNFAALIFLSGSISIQPSVLAPYVAVPFNRTHHYYDPSDVEWDRVAEAVIKNFGQVFLLENTIAGILVFLGMALCSPLSTLLALWGSILGITTALLSRADLKQIYSGLWGYNSVLGAQAIGANYSSFVVFFFLRHTHGTCLHELLPVL
jgi:solute carrier family 14 (urea transporter)/urea transporter